MALEISYLLPHVSILGSTGHFNFICQRYAGSVGVQRDAAPPRGWNIHDRLITLRHDSEL